MKKKCLISVMLIAVILCIGVISFRTEYKKSDQWLHKSVEGTVTDIWEENDSVYFTVDSIIHNDTYDFVITDEALACFDFCIGDEVVVETDYNIREHNGKDKPYPAVLIADANVHDESSGRENKVYYENET